MHGTRHSAILYGKQLFTVNTEKRRREVEKCYGVKWLVSGCSYVGNCVMIL